ncbi:MAG: tryptophan synthase subunit alpha [Desulfobacterales bacterium]|jgi:tryptophan synthase alpha chain|nr:tryptophan synthase subunit alpha [Desulfobacterales bacterium]
MNRIDATFERLAGRNEKALVGFVTAGDPDLGQSLRIIAAMCAAGLDLLELGVPFSDPTADGPVIQRSSGRALAAGIGLNQVLEMVAALRRKTPIPMVVFSYYNPILAYGAAAFHRDALGAGADGVLVVDLPPEESAELTDLWPDNDLCLIRLTSPTTPPERMRRIAASASGFIYHVSQLGVTGSEGLQPEEIAGQLHELRKATRLPVCVGFGISSPAQVAAVARIADGVVIGSAFERLIEANIARPDLPEILAARVAELKHATRRT